ncbi:hypothetical protein ACF061_30410 [Streptomyces sp. NPDC015220]|uniref:hypothetical protein n=1 Tax=Streptomyces sp. NPDC015220 TaxID=3364947 RepID=UPI0036FDBC15
MDARFKAGPQRGDLYQMTAYCVRLGLAGGHPVHAGRLRTLDAIHVAGALALRDDLTALVTYARRMLETARAEGPPAHAPGMAD